MSGDPSKDKPKASQFKPIIGGFGGPAQDPGTTRPKTVEVSSMAGQRQAKGSDVATTFAREATTASVQEVTRESLEARLLALEPRFRQSVYLDFDLESQYEISPEADSTAVALVEEAAGSERLGQLAASVRRAEYLSNLLGK